MVEKVLIANRGEIALRIVRSCRELGIATVAVFSTVDKKALHVQLADEAVCVGDSLSNKSYLNIPNILAAATSRGVDAIHPGYGFLAENDKFAEMCNDHGIVFIGPSPKAIRSMGDKSTAKETMEAVGVPTVPGSKGLLSNVDEAYKLADDIGYPVIIKATAGGGGRGMRLVENSDNLEKMFKAAQGEAEAAFGNDGLYMEKFIKKPRHVEIQILADRSGNVVHLGERDCSVQRRHQKLLEESPSPAINTELRKKMGNAAIAAAKSIGYEGAGTVEFLVDDDDNFYFMEMNTRIQVEHPVTEMVTGVDLIAEQIKIASGANLEFNQDDIHLNGHAIECRINAEDPKTFMPSPGKIEQFHSPGGLGIRLDSGIYSGYNIPPYYDSLIAKLIAHGKNRKECILKLKQAIKEMVIEPIPSTLELYQNLLENPDIINGDFDIKWLEQIYLNGK